MAGYCCFLSVLVLAFLGGANLVLYHTLHIKGNSSHREMNT